MRLTNVSTQQDLKDAAGLQAWTLDQQLQKGELTLMQRNIFLTALAEAALTLAGLTKPKRTRKPKAAPPPTKPAPKRPRKKTNG